VSARSACSAPNTSAGTIATIAAVVRLVINPPPRENVAGEATIGGGSRADNQQHCAILVKMSHAAAVDVSCVIAGRIAMR
jgi:hypothetical protein